MYVVRAAALLLGLFSATLVHATAQRTFVASGGSDGNTAFNCSIVKPCRGFAAAVGVTSAKGEVIVLDSAGYGPILSITQPITVTAPTGIYAGISVFTGDGITINAGVSDTVVLRGLTINGQGGANGVTINNALTVHVENCVIANMTGMGINQLKGQLEVKDTIVRNNANIGIYVVGPAQANLDHVRLEANNTGLAAEFGGSVAMQDSVVTGSSNICVLASSGTYLAPSSVTIAHSLISACNFGIYVESANSANANTFLNVSDSAISGNSVGMYVNGPMNQTFVNVVRNNISGNGLGISVDGQGWVRIDSNLFGENLVNDLKTVCPGVLVSSGNNINTRGYNLCAFPLATPPVI